MEPTDVIREKLIIEPPKTGLFIWQDTEIVTHPITKQREPRPYGKRRFAIDGVEVFDEAAFMAEKAKRDAEDAQRVVERQQEAEDLVAEQTTQRLASRERAAAARERNA